MKCCACCLVLLFAMVGLSLAVSVWQNYWPIILGLSLSWASLRYLKQMQR